MADKVAKKHHEKSKVCYSRPSYREARWERAVKVYTINLESKYIVVSGVASVGVSQELVDKFSSYGNIQEYFKLEDYPTEQFTEAYLIKYEKINNARFAKRKMDNKSFFGGILHVFYAPEYESVDECRHKLEERRKIISKKTQGTTNQDGGSSCTNHETAKDRHITTHITTSNTPSVVTSISESTATLVSDTLAPSSYFLQHNYPNQNSHVWNLPPLPPPPCETRPSFPPRQFLSTPSNPNSNAYRNQPVHRFDYSSHQQPIPYINSTQKRHSGTDSLSSSQSAIPSKKQRKRI
ncbi:RNA-binding protein 48 [Exaiptasia diaphana]|uniref:RNA-binding protein 48 n=1 Tax=Exaiptasia diaphana TaxID=2652724 RepID=A0A913WZJ8_EXADI|nr:RNA-binding protein 48 [Exaiptasia diaphana]